VTSFRPLRNWLVVWGLLAGLAAAAVVVRPTNHDTAWYLYMAGNLLDGGTPYVDVVDTNPPLIVLVTLPPVWIARVIHAAPETVFPIYVFLLGLGSAWASVLVVRRLWPAAPAAVHGVLGAGLFFLVLAFPKGDYGQREHLTVIFTLPYVLMAALRAVDGRVSRGAAIAAGIAAAIGFAMKPHFAVAWLAVEAVLAVLRRTPRTVLRPEAIAVLATAAAYGLVVATVFPQYFDVAGRVWQVYGGLDSPVSRLIGLRELQIAVVAAALVALIRLPRDAQAPVSILAAAAFGFLAASLLQLKGWGYQMLPPQAYLALFFLVMMLCLAQATAFAELLRGGVRGIGVAVLLALMATGVKYVYEGRRGAATSLVTPLAALVGEHAPGGPIATLAMRTLVHPSFPLVNQTRARWSLRHHSLWFLPAFYERELATPPPAPIPLHAPEAMPALERAFYEEIIGDLCRTPPRLLLAEVAAPQSPAGRRALDLVSYYRKDARFERLFRAYDGWPWSRRSRCQAARPLTYTTMAPMLAFTP
jgi:hypothetical protein